MSQGPFMPQRWDSGGDRLRRFWIGEDVLDQERRNEILRAIAEARAVAREVDSRLATLPAWALAPGSPLGKDRERLIEAGGLRQSNEPKVAVVERRLAGPGPMWPVLTDDEKAALDQWIAAIAMQGDVLDKYLPSDLSKDLKKLALLGIGLGALFAPLFWTEDEPDRPRILPIRFPDWPVPGVRRPLPRPALPAPALPSPPAAFRPRAAIPVPAAPIRIPGPVASPFRGVGPAAAAAIPVPAAPFAGIPPTAPPIQVAPGVFRPAAAPAPIARPLAPAGPGPHMPIYPRYQRVPR